MLDAPETAGSDGGFRGAFGRGDGTGGCEAEGGAGGEWAHEAGDKGRHRGGHEEGEKENESAVADGGENCVGFVRVFKGL